jgi:putative ABC transport system substrate-binding protein
LRGTPAGKLLIEDPTTIELVINLKTARALGIDLSFCLLAQANNGIEVPTQWSGLTHTR